MIAFLKEINPVSVSWYVQLQFWCLWMLWGLFRFRYSVSWSSTLNRDFMVWTLPKKLNLWLMLVNSLASPENNSIKNVIGIGLICFLSISWANDYSQSMCLYNLWVWESMLHIHDSQGLVYSLGLESMASALNLFKIVVLGEQGTSHEPAFPNTVFSFLG